MENERIYISNLLAGPTKKALVGLVVAKYDKRSFPDKKEYGVMKCQLNFILRDTPSDFINVSCWGSENYIATLSDSFSLGSVVQLSDFLVRTKSNNEYEEKYNPWTPSDFQVSVSENFTKLKLYDGADQDHILTLTNFPTRDHDDYYTLGDILCNSHNLNGSNVNVLACVKEIGKVKEFTSKNGRNIVKREVILFDEFCGSFPLIIWDKEVANSIDQWNESHMILFLVDVKVSFEEFRQKMVASVTSKTIITINPDTPQGHHLMAFSLKNNGGIVNNIYENNIENIEGINDIFTVDDLVQKLYGERNSMLSTPFTGAVYAVVSNFDIDKDAEASYIIYRCGQCKRRVLDTENGCTNQVCENQPRDQMTSSLELRISMSDHTSGIDNVMLFREVAERILECSANDFLTMENEERISLKWKFLFERFKIVFKAYPPGQERKKPIVTILDLQSADDLLI